MTSLTGKFNPGSIGTTTATAGSGCMKLNEGSSTWVATFMVPMAFVTFAMFVLDVLQRLYPHNNNGLEITQIPTGSKFRREKAQKTKLKPEPEYTETSIKIGSIFGKRSGEAAAGKNKKYKKRSMKLADVENLNPFAQHLYNIVTDIEKPFGFTENAQNRTKF